MAHREDRYLPIVKLTMEDVLERPLRRVPPQVKATYDFETSDGLSPKIAAEIKELIPSDYLQLRQEVSKQRSVDLSALTMRWNVTIKGETLANRLQPVPDFPDPSPEIIAFWSGVGHVATKAEREIEWRANQTLRPKSQVMLKGLGREIETHLSVLERNGITNTWGRLPVETSELEAVKRALASINQRTHGALCNSRRPRPNEHAGIDLCFAYGERRTQRADSVAERAQLWLDSESSKNLCSSLRDSGADEKHGILWMESDAEREVAEEMGTAFCPTRVLNLPSEIDVLWIFLPPLTLKYIDGWSVYSLQ